MLSVLKLNYARVFHSRMTREAGLFFLIAGASIYLAKNIILLFAAAAVLTCLLQPVFTSFSKLGCTRWLAATGSMVVLLSLVFLFIRLFGPIVQQQWLLLEGLLEKVQSYTYKCIQMLFPLYLKYVKENGWETYAQQISMPVLELGKPVLNSLWTMVKSSVSAVLYILLCPLISFFLLLDGPRLLTVFRKYIFAKNTLLLTILQRARAQFFIYLQGKCYECLVVGISSGALFAMVGFLNAWWLGALIGVSVFLPYIGTILATLPVLICAMHQWSITTPALWITVGGYAAVQCLDALLLVPFLFSRTLSLHPIIVFLATLVFGGWFGFWGLLFAIPLASLIQTVWQVWPARKDHTLES